MSLKACFVYQWATYGGVERVFLNRAYAFEATSEDVQIDVYYGADGGGLAAFVRAIQASGLEHRIRVVREFDQNCYDVVFVIDSPGMLPTNISGKARWVVECHTPYQTNRMYLDTLPRHVAEIAVPSTTFARTLEAERPAFANRIRVLRNCVSPCRDGQSPELPAWRKRPLLYFGRLDELKNPQGFLDLLRELERRRPGKYFGAVVGPEVPGYDFNARVERAGLHGMILRMPPLQFLRTSAFLQAWHRRGGLMVSPSRGESFGLAAAEAIATGLPVLLSNLPEHAELLGDDTGHLYNPDDPVAGADRIEKMVSRYDECSMSMKRRAIKFGNEAFICDWKALIRDLGFTETREEGATLRGSN